MSGPRVTSGTDSRQDYGTPANLLQACQERFGTIILDLAAHQANHICAFYIAPEYFTDVWDPDKMDAMDLVRSLVARGAHEDEAFDVVYTPAPKAKLRVKNYDSSAYALDTFKQDWSAMQQNIEHIIGQGGLPDRDGILWLNPEFNDIAPYARKCQIEAAQGANILLLTPMVLTDWYVRHVAGSADVYQLSGRVSFDGKHPFPKDCMVSHFHPKATGTLAIWDWRQDRILERWSLG